MSDSFFSYAILIIVLIVSVLVDMGWFSAKNKMLNFSLAIKQFIFWIIIAIIYGAFLYFEFGSKLAINYFSAYLLEKSLSIDNIFVFIILFKVFAIEPNKIGRLLLYGIFIAIILRFIVISIGISIIDQYSWILYIFGFILLISGIKMFLHSEEDQYNPKEGIAYKVLNKYLRIDYNASATTFYKTIDGKFYITNLFVVVLLLGITDLIFAVDSIPAVLAISSNKLVVFSSNLFAILGLRSLFILLQSASNKFDYLQQGISLALIFIGIKLLLVFWGIHFPDWLSFLIILLCVILSMVYSYFIDKKNRKSRF